MIFQIAVPVLAAACGALGARLAVGPLLRDPPRTLVRSNVDGKQVPAVLGVGVMAGTVLGTTLVLLYVALVYQPEGVVGEAGVGMDLVIVKRPFHLAWVALLAVGPLFAAGLWDDLRGDEKPRGFRGHFGALRGGAVTGGLIKLLTGVAVGFLTVWALDERVSFHPLVILMAAVVALSANLLNLLDRAPGRAGKVFLVLALPLALLDPSYRLIVAGGVGCACALLPLDLRARGMLGDAGANPLGAMAGLGLVLALPATYAWMGATVAVLLALNLASEKWSFSRAIERTPWLGRLDQLGRK